MSVGVPENLPILFAAIGSTVALGAAAGFSGVTGISNVADKMLYFCLKLYGTASLVFTIRVCKGVLLIDLLDPSGYFADNKYVW